MYTRFRMSFWKQEPPKPTEAFRNLLPMRLSVPMACDTCGRQMAGQEQAGETFLYPVHCWVMMCG